MKQSIRGKGRPRSLLDMGMEATCRWMKGNVFARVLPSKGLGCQSMRGVRQNTPSTTRSLFASDERCWRFRRLRANGRQQLAASRRAAADHHAARGASRDPCSVGTPRFDPPSEERERPPTSSSLIVLKSLLRVATASRAGRPGATNRGQHAGGSAIVGMVYPKGAVKTADYSTFRKSAFAHQHYLDSITCTLAMETLHWDIHHRRPSHFVGI